MTSISSALAELRNLFNAANWHKEHCQDEHCGVSVTQLKFIALRLLPMCKLKERKEAQDLINCWPI